MGTEIDNNGSAKAGLSRLHFALARVALLAGLPAMGAVVVVYVYHLASNIRGDTTAVTNGAFIISGTLSALCFSWSQSLLPEDEDRNRVLRAGERLLHSSLFLVIASVLKYAALTLMTYQTAGIPSPTLHLIGDAFGILAAPLFLFAVVDAFAGTFMMFRTLRPRTRYFTPPPPP